MSPLTHLNLSSLLKELVHLVGFGVAFLVGCGKEECDNLIEKGLKEREKGSLTIIQN